MSLDDLIQALLRSPGAGDFLEPAADVSDYCAAVVDEQIENEKGPVAKRDPSLFFGSNPGTTPRTELYQASAAFDQRLL